MCTGQLAPILPSPTNVAATGGHREADCTNEQQEDEDEQEDEEKREDEDEQGDEEDEEE